MMGAPNAERTARVRAAYKAFNAGDLEAATEFLADDVEFHPLTSSLDTGPLRGPEALRRLLSPDLFESQQIYPLDIVERGDRMLVEARVTFRGRTSGVEMETALFQVLTWRGDQIAVLESYEDRERARAALERPDSRSPASA